MRPGPVFEAIPGNNSNAVAVRADDLDAKRLFAETIAAFGVVAAADIAVAA